MIRPMVLRHQDLLGYGQKNRLLHNGSVESLEDLFCIYGERTDDQVIFGNIGHTFGCDLPYLDKTDIIEFF